MSIKICDSFLIIQFVKRAAAFLILLLYLLLRDGACVFVAQDFGEDVAEGAIDIAHEEVDEKEGDGAEDGDRPIVKDGDDVGSEHFEPLQAVVEGGERGVDEDDLDGIGDEPLDLFLPHHGGDERHGTEIDGIARDGGDVADEEAEPRGHDVGEDGGGVVMLGDGSHDGYARRREHRDGDVAHHHAQPDKQKRQRGGDARQRKRVSSLSCGDATSPFHQQQRMRSPPMHSQQQSAQMAH